VIPRTERTERWKTHQQAEEVEREARSNRQPKAQRRLHSARMVRKEPSPHKPPECAATVETEPQERIWNNEGVCLWRLQYNIAINVRCPRTQTAAGYNAMAMQRQVSPRKVGGVQNRQKEQTTDKAFERGS
jgi:hypothetical protein